MVPNEMYNHSNFFCCSFGCSQFLIQGKQYSTTIHIYLISSTGYKKVSTSASDGSSVVHSPCWQDLTNSLKTALCIKVNMIHISCSLQLGDKNIQIQLKYEITLKQYINISETLQLLQQINKEMNGLLSSSQCKYNTECLTFTMASNIVKQL